MKKKIIIVGLGVSYFCSACSMNYEQVYSGNATSQNVKTYIVLCSGIDAKNGALEDGSTKGSNDSSGPGPEPSRLSIGAITVDGDLTEINKDTRNIVWSAAVGFGRIDDCSSARYRVKLDVAYSDKGYRRKGTSIGDEIVVNYQNGQKETFVLDGRFDAWKIKDEPCYLHNRGDSPVSIIKRASYRIDARNIWNHSLRKNGEGTELCVWRYSSALSIGGFLKILGRCCDGSVSHDGKKLAPRSWFGNKENSVSLCESFLVEAGLLESRKKRWYSGLFAYTEEDLLKRIRGE